MRALFEPVQSIEFLNIRIAPAQSKTIFQKIDRINLIFLQQYNRIGPAQSECLSQSRLWLNPEKSDQKGIFPKNGLWLIASGASELEDLGGEVLQHGSLPVSVCACGLLLVCCYS